MSVWRPHASSAHERRPVKNEENVRERVELGRKRVCEEHESRAIAARMR